MKFTKVIFSSFIAVIFASQGAVAASATVDEFVTADAQVSICMDTCCGGVSLGKGQALSPSMPHEYPI
jgi:hypothetical protein